MAKKKVELQPPPPSIVGFPDFSPQFKEDLGWWYKTTPSKVNKIFELVTDTIKHPFEGIGKPEALKHTDSDTWSRRIDLFIGSGMSEWTFCKLVITID